MLFILLVSRLYGSFILAFCAFCSRLPCVENLPSAPFFFRENKVSAVFALHRFDRVGDTHPPGVTSHLGSGPQRARQLAGFCRVDVNNPVLTLGFHAGCDEDKIVFHGPRFWV